MTKIQIYKYGYVEIHYTEIRAQTTSFEIDIETPTQISYCKYYSNMKIFNKNKVLVQGRACELRVLCAASCGELAIRRWLVSAIEIGEAV